MKKFALMLLLAFLCLPPAGTHASDSDLDAVLTAAEGLFTSMQKKDCSLIWSLLSKKSRDTIVSDVCAAMKSAAPARERVADDFSRGGAISKTYWEAYLKNFDPSLVLEQCKWEMGQMKADRAEIVITFRKAQHPATLYMSREDGSWRVELTEPFWARK
jgi:hypothetical protein